MDLILLGGVLLSLLSIAVLQYYSLTLQKASSWAKLPPGKTGLPWIGESLEFVSCVKDVHLEKFTFKRMLKYCPDVFRTSIYGDHVTMLCGSEGNKFLFTRENRSVKSWVVRPTQWIFRVDRIEGPFQKHIKPEIVRFVSVDGLKKIVGVMDAMAQHHLKTYWDPVKVITVYPSVKRYAFALACRVFMSIEDPEVVDSLYGGMDTFVNGFISIPLNLPGTQMNRSLKAGNVVRSQLQQIVRQQAKSSDHTNNFLAHLLRVCEDEKDIIDGIMLMLLAGTDTVASALCMTLKVMSDQLDTYSRVYQENMEIQTVGDLLDFEDTRKMKYTWNVVREVMRLYPPTGFLAREALTDFTYAGYDIPKGSKLMTNIHATHKDPKYFPNPQKFDPSRFDGDGPLPYTFLPFGGGSHLCPGMNYTQQLILVFIHNVVKKFKWEAQISGERLSGIPFPKPYKGFPIILHPHAY